MVKPTGAATHLLNKRPYLRMRDGNRKSVIKDGETERTLRSLAKEMGCVEREREAAPANGCLEIKRLNV